MEKVLHVIAFDLPFPPNYGGSTDMYYKLMYLRKLGISIKLHVFLYGGKKQAPELLEVANEVYYYSRKKYQNPFIGKLPFIVSSRKNNQLLNALLQDNYPILFEGLHTTYFLNHPEIQKRICVVRAHNVEHNYYQALSEAEESALKKIFFRLEARKLRDYESILINAHGIAGISPAETAYLQDHYGKSEYIPAFHSNNSVQCRSGHGDFVLYHGNLSVPENNRAALYLAEHVFSKLNMPCVIAGSHPSATLRKEISRHTNILLKANISTSEILELIASAHVNAMITFQSTGIKLKLLNSLYRGRFVVANSPMVEETQLDQLCEVADTSEGLQQAINKCFDKDFGTEEQNKRIETLMALFDNQLNAEKLAKMFGW